MRDRTTDYETFRKTYEGLEPEQIVDLMGLAGDSSDNVPGVPGIGEKTALRLIRSHESIEGVYDHLEEVSGKKLKENLALYKEQALLSRRLVTIDCRVPLDTAVEDLEVGEPDPEELTEVFRELEFRELWDQFASKAATPVRRERLCLDEDAVLSLVKDVRRCRRVSLDTETTSTDPFKADLVGISFSWEEEEAAYVPVGHRYLGVPEQLTWERARSLLKEVLEDSAVEKIGQNIKYDAIVLRRHGVRLQWIRFDTMIASYVINPGMRAAQPGRPCTALPESPDDRLP